jgi:hypothetical protein
MIVAPGPHFEPEKLAAELAKKARAVGLPPPPPSVAALFADANAEQSRSLNPCGQVAGGRFGEGNTCAAGDNDGSGGGTSVGASISSQPSSENQVPSVTFADAADSAAFAAARDKSKTPWFLSSHSVEELAPFDKRMAEGGKVGYMIEPKTGDFGNLFNNGGTRGAGKAAIVDAIKRGAKTLDCFGPDLPILYSKAGYVPVAKLKFVDEYVPKDWPYDTLGRPDVIVMSYTGGERSSIAQRFGTFPSYKHPAEYSEDFDAAKQRARELSEAHDAAIAPR